MLKVKEISERLGVTLHTVLAWIQSGELPALDLSRKKGGKPQWRITPEDFEKFLAGRRSTPVVRQPRRKRQNVPLDEGAYY